MGDQYRWIPNKSVQNGGRPENGNMDGEEYGECPLCRLDFHVKVLIREDVIAGVEPDLEKASYIPTIEFPDRTVVKEFFSPDMSRLVLILRRPDGLYEIRGCQRIGEFATDITEMLYSQLASSNHHPPLTDTLENAEKLAREELISLTGKRDGEVFGRMITHIDEIPLPAPRPVRPIAPEIPTAIPTSTPSDKTEQAPMRKPGKIDYNPNWELTNKRKVALLRLAELGVDVTSTHRSDDFRLFVPFNLLPDEYVEIGYLMAQLGDEDFPNGFHHPIAFHIKSKLFDGKFGYQSPVSSNDSLPHALRYTVTPKKELKR
ncbi:MAG: hypothetical protein AB1649_23250 [Chloroflexota bacterium]